MQCLLSCAFMHALCCFSSISCFRNKWESCSSVNRCGNFRFSYPFGRRDCGDPDFQLRFHPMDRHPMLNISGNKYQIMEPYILGNNSINHSIMIAIDNFKLDKCKVLDNYTQSLWHGNENFEIAPGYTNLTFWRDCDQSKYSEKNYTGTILELSLCGNIWYYSFSREIETLFCKTHLQLPIKKEVLQFNKSIINQTLVGQGFEIRWHVDPYRDQNCGVCLMSNGICGYHISKAVLCYCRDGTSQPDKCHASPSSKLVPILLGSIGGAVLVVVMCLILFCRRIRQRKNYDRTDENLAARGNFEQFLFDYEVLREATGNFDGNNMLGKGGYGEVYKPYTKEDHTSHLPSDDI